MKQLFFLLTIALSKQTGLSQTIGTAAERSALGSSIAIGTLAVDRYTTVDLVYKDVKGSPYLEKDILKGVIVLLDGGKTPEVPLQHDLYSGDFFYVDPNGDQLVINTKACKEILLQGNKEAYYFKRANPKTPDQFYDILYEDDNLYIYNNPAIILREGTDNGIVKTDPTFNRDDNYYVLLKGGKPKKIKLKKKDIFKQFSKQDQATMEAYAKQNKLKLKKAAEFKEMFKSLTQI